MQERMTKRDWLMALQCRLQAWHLVRNSSNSLSESEQFLMEQGHEVGDLARELFPTGIFVSPADSKSAAEATAAILANMNVHATFEASFEWDSLIARADVLERLTEGWHVLEVKSSFSDTKSLGNLVDDLAYTVMVAKGTGLIVKRASLALLTREYRHGEPAEKLFQILDVTDNALTRANEFAKEHKAMTAAVLGEQSPEPVLCSACRSCSYFDSDCLGKGLPHSVLELPGLNHTKLRQLADQSIIALESLPADFALNETQQRAKDAAQQGQMIVADGLRRSLDNVQWPSYYLDFETVATVLPLYPGHGCHEQHLTQFSVHHRDVADGDLGHREFLAETHRDCQRELAEALIADLDDTGSVLVYSHFEKQRIKALASLFPDLAVALQAIQDRLFDLHPLIKNHVYHPDFRGSFSIKSVLPALVPDLDYSGLEIAGGDAAITRFARMARGEITGIETERSRDALLKYCKTDTLAMVRLHDVLIGLAE